MSYIMQYHKSEQPDPPVATKLPSVHLSAEPQLTNALSLFARPELGTLPIALRSPDVTIRKFKTALHSYHLTALEECYSVEDPRTWKTTCPKCNTSRCLHPNLTCCF